MSAILLGNGFLILEFMLLLVLKYEIVVVVEVWLDSEQVIYLPAR